MSEQVIAPIETQYRGWRFRSRLEARWAVALDSAGFRWEYEPEGFETPCGRYLPDFRVALDALDPTQRYWLEIKPDDYQINDTDMGRWISVSRGTGSVLLVACGLGTFTIVVTPDHVYAHEGRPGFIRSDALVAARSARFEFGESGGPAS